MIPLFKVFMNPTAKDRVAETLDSGFIAEGKRVKEFEDRFSNWLGRPVAAVSSCTASLHLALEMIGVRDTNVISTPMTAEPTNTAILQAGGKIVWADVEKNGNISPESIREILSKTLVSAIMVVHYGGIPVNLEEINFIALQHGVPVIEDCAHALGAKYGGLLLGNHSDYCCFSLQAIKTISTADGGFLASPDLTRSKSLRWFGIDREASRTSVDITELGYKYNMNDVTASIGLAQMDSINEVIQHYIDNGKYFDEHLSGIPGIELLSWDDAAEPSYWLYTLLADRRDDLSRMLTEKGIGNGLCHKRNDQHTVFADSARYLPGLDDFYSNLLHLPTHTGVNQEEREYIVDTIKGGW